MKFVRFLLNSLMFCGVLFITFLGSYFTSWALTAQTGETHAQIAIVNNSENNKVSYQDAITFWGTEIGENFKNDPKYRSRNWFGWEWWKDYPGYGLDYATDIIVGVVSPVVVPLWNVNQVKEYYIEDFYYDSNYETVPLESTIPYIKEYHAAEIDKRKGTGYTELALNAFEVTLMSSDAEVFMSYDQWVDEYPTVYEYMFRTAKYNVVNEDGRKAYENIYNKFISTINGERIINTGVYILYLNIYIDIAFSLWVVIQYPIRLKQNEFNEVEVDSGFLNRRKRKKQKRKEG